MPKIMLNSETTDEAIDEFASMICREDNFPQPQPESTVSFIRATKKAWESRLISKIGALEVSSVLKGSIDVVIRWKIPKPDSGFHVLSDSRRIRLSETINGDILGSYVVYGMIQDFSCAHNVD